MTPGERIGTLEKAKEVYQRLNVTIGKITQIEQALKVADGNNNIKIGSFHLSVTDNNMATIRNALHNQLTDYYEELEELCKGKE